LFNSIFSSSVGDLILELIYEDHIGIDVLEYVSWDKEAIKILQQKKDNEALADASKILVEDPTNKIALQVKINILISQKKYEEAIDTIDKALSLNSNNPILWVLKGRIYLFKKDLSSALNYIEKALWITPKSLAALQEKLLVIFLQEEFNDALIISNLLIKEDPKNFIGWAFRGFCFSKLGKEEEALASLERAIKLNSTDFQVIYEKTKLLAKLNKHKKILRCYKRLLEIDPENTTLWVKYSNLLYRLKKHDDALKGYTSAIQIMIKEKKTGEHFYRYYVDPDTEQLSPKEQVLENYYYHLLLLGPFASTSEWLKNEEVKKYTSGNIFALPGFEDALNYYSTNPKINSKDLHDWHTAGLILYHFKYYVAAANCFRKVVKMNLYSSIGWFYLGMALFMANQFEDGFYAIDRAIKLNPELKDKFKPIFEAIIKRIDVYKQIYLWRLRKKERTYERGS